MTQCKSIYCHLTECYINPLSALLSNRNEIIFYRSILLFKHPAYSYIYSSRENICRKLRCLQCMVYLNSKKFEFFLLLIYHYTPNITDYIGEDVPELAYYKINVIFCISYLSTTYLRFLDTR